MRYKSSTLVFFIGCWLSQAGLSDQAPYAGMGGRAGEVTASSANLQVRLTAHEGQKLNFAIDPAPGYARVVVRHANGKTTTVSDWKEASLSSDGYLQFRVNELSAGTEYSYYFEMRREESGEVRASPVYTFVTAPSPDVLADVSAHITTCQSHQGLPVFDVMGRQKTDFLVATGDNVYYDKYDVRSVEEAYWLFQKDWGTPYTINYLASRAAYFMKDDHDYRFNDADPFSPGTWQQKRSWEGYNGLTRDLNRDDKDWLTHEEGIEVFKTVFPASDLPYRTFRWGKGVQIWLLEGRDYRSANDLPDQEGKSVWGEAQSAWLKKTLTESDAAFRIIISPTPIIGPDKLDKFDNHANRNGFMIEGRNFMDWLISNGLSKNTIVVCGDRHWQYHSVYREAVHEFCVGPTSAYRALPVVPSEDPAIDQKFSLSAGGFFRFDYRAAESALDLIHFDEWGRETYRYSLAGDKSK